MVDRVTPSLRNRTLKRHKALVNERSAYDTHWKSIADNLLPRSSRFQSTSRNRSSERNDKIIDSTATQALRVLAAGMMSGMTSPARPWFRLATPDSDVMKTPASRAWLFQVQQIMLRIFAKSNTYNALHSTYRELGAFGTSASVIVPDFERVMHQHPQTIGEYTFGLDHLGYVTTMTREFDLSVEQIVGWFGYKNCSSSVRSNYDSGNYDKAATLVHVIQPRADRDDRKRDAKNKRWSDVYLEKGGDGDTGPNGGVLQESGHSSFPVLTPRWDVLWNDSYGSGPGMDALGDLLALQHQQFRKARAIDYQTDPPLQLPVSLRGQQADLLPGGVSYYDATTPSGGIRTAFEVNLDLSHLLADIGDVRDRMRSSFYADLFLMLSTADVKGMTATEVAERHEEKLLMLGPVLERLHAELLSPLIESTFERMVAVGIVPPPPEELAGADLDIEYVSMLAQAQKAVSVNSTDRLVGHIGTLMNLNPNVVDKFDTDKSIDRYADQLGVDPDLIVGNEQVAMIRSQRAQAQQAAAQQEAMMQSADAIAKLGGVANDGSNLGTDAVNLFSGYGSPSPVEVAMS